MIAPDPPPPPRSQMEGSSAQLGPQTPNRCWQTNFRLPEVLIASQPASFTHRQAPSSVSPFGGALSSTPSHVHSLLKQLKAWQIPSVFEMQAGSSQSWIPLQSSS